MDSTVLITVSIAVGAVSLFVLGLSITLIRKGHNIESDVGSNREMKKRGIECVSAQIRRQESQRLSKREYLTGGCIENCDQCGISGVEQADSNCRKSQI